MAAADGLRGPFLADRPRRVARVARNARRSVIINVELPDLSGFDLVEMLQPFPKGTTVFLVADQYAVEDEVRALRLGVSSYLCKPLGGSVLHECRSIQRRSQIVELRKIIHVERR